MDFLQLLFLFGLFIVAWIIHIKSKVVSSKEYIERHQMYYGLTYVLYFVFYFLFFIRCCIIYNLTNNMIYPILFGIASQMTILSSTISNCQNIPSPSSYSNEVPNVIYVSIFNGVLMLILFGATIGAFTDSGLERGIFKFEIGRFINFAMIGVINLIFFSAASKALKTEKVLKWLGDTFKIYLGSIELTEFQERNFSKMHDHHVKSLETYNLISFINVLATAAPLFMYILIKCFF